MTKKKAGNQSGDLANYTQIRQKIWSMLDCYARRLIAVGDFVSCSLLPSQKSAGMSIKQTQRTNTRQ